jgi:hypothetical protein
MVSGMTSQTRFFEPLTSENAALVLVDHQVGLMTGVRDYSIRRAETQRGGSGHSGESAEAPDRRDHHGA